MKLPLHPFRALLALATVAGGLVACVGNDGARDGELVTGDAGAGDASAPSDATVSGDSAVDGGYDVPRGCSLSGALVVTEASAGALGDYALGGGAESFRIVYSQGDDPPQLLTRELVGGPTLRPSILLGSSVARPHPAIVSTGEAWLLAHEDVVEGARQIVAYPLAPSGEPLGDVTRADLSGGPGTGVDLARAGDRIVAAYRLPEGVAVRSIDTNGRPTDEPILAASGAALSVQIASSSTGSYVAWSRTNGSIEGRRLRVTTRTLEALHDLNAGDPAPTGAFALGFGGVSYGALTGLNDADVRTTRFRRIADNGDVAPEPQLLPYAGGHYAAFSIARFAAGFAVAYRRAEFGRNQLRLALLSARGDVLYDTFLRTLLSGEGDVVARQAADGRVAIAWDDTAPDGRLLRVAEVTCHF